MYGTVTGISAGRYSTGPSPTPLDRKEVEPSKPPIEASQKSPENSVPHLSEAGELSKATTLPQTVAFANTMAELFNTKLSFNFDERIGRVVVRVKAGNTDEVIRQIPPEQMVELAVKFKSQLRGLILNDQG